ncbi:hypothetical protein BpHYR1_040258 [Brachionus plicatilis]|uniref:Uncharacterized protein n=1 Tax=Brachionus plicatilis TaxID=10195 RepID=A0A3M7RSJ0_BRAPC|nr:hypothetical protein BpHYR1_040258 [Brachionus plicatilis]
MTQNNINSSNNNSSHYQSSRRSPSVVNNLAHHYNPQINFNPTTLNQHYVVFMIDVALESFETSSSGKLSISASPLVARMYKLLNESINE